ncbi:hypothetical protein UR09_04185 [Candidatus Nitromaritima sp. SCGC AAA799-A02]|nr:hypothetical protein UR09_04185 [Candidatus Nitromaritima sp. SCGC AAA799-A02]KMP12177.1 hypothetical protein UZ36_01785 [Candidatus Nitromaritima sp. SCGC AAA799-C22]
MGLSEQILGVLSSQEFSIPLGQVIVFTLINTICLAMAKHKLGLIISFSFIYYWGFVFNREFFIGLIGESSTGLYIYSFCGLAMVAMAIIGFMREKS